MMKRSIATTFCILTVFVAGSVFAADAKTTSAGKKSVDQEIVALQKQIDELRAQTAEAQQKADAAETQAAQKSSKKFVSSPKCPGGKCEYNPSRLRIGPYIAKDDDYMGDELPGMDATTRADAYLLMKNYKEQQEADALGIPEPPVPSLEIGGKVEVQAQHDQFAANQSQGAKSPNTFSFNSFDLFLYARMSKWISGLVDLEATPSASNDLSKTQVDIYRAFITIGNLSVTPFFLSIGQMYAPFGRQANNLPYSGPANQIEGRILAKMVNLGFEQTGDNAFYANLYSYQGVAKINNSHPYQYGGDVGYNYKLGKVSGKADVGYVSNITDSKGIHGEFSTCGFWDSKNGGTGPADCGTGTKEGDEFTWHKSVPAADAYVTANIGPISLYGEYMQVTQAFDKRDLRWHGKGADPKFFYVEGDYNFNTGSHPSYVGVGYDHATQSAGLDIPKTQYIAYYSIGLFRHTNLQFELAHKVYYSPDDAGASTAGDTTFMDSQAFNDLGKSENVGTVVFDLYF